MGSQSPRPALPAAERPPAKSQRCFRRFMCEPGCNIWAAVGEEKSRRKVWGVLRRAEGAGDGWQEETALGFLPSLGGNKTRRE